MKTVCVNFLKKFRNLFLIFNFLFYIKEILISSLNMSTTNNTDLTFDDVFTYDYAELLVNEFNALSKQTLNERINGHVIDLVYYNKYIIGLEIKTGTAFMLNEVKNLTVVKIILSNKMAEEMKEKIISKLSVDDVIVKTAHGDIHIYCNTNFFPITSNRMTAYYESPDYRIDLLSYYDGHEYIDIILPNSKILHSTVARSIIPNEILTYEFIRGGYDSVIKRSLKDVLSDLKVSVTPEVLC